MNPNPDISTDRKSSAIRVEIQNIEMLKKPYCANADILSTLDLDITNIKQEPEWEHENDITSALEFESEEVKFQCNELNIVKVEQDSLDHVIKTELQSVSEDEYSSNNQVNFQESAADDFSNIERERNLHVTQDTNTVSARGICENNRDDINGQNGNNINVVFVPVVVNYVPVLKSILLKPANVPSKNQVEFENKEVEKISEEFWRKCTSRDFFRMMDSEFEEIDIDQRIASDFKFAVKLGVQPIEAICSNCSFRRKLFYTEHDNSVCFRCNECKTNSSPFDGTFKGKFGHVSWECIFSFIWHLLCIECSLTNTCMAVGISTCISMDWANYVRLVMRISVSNMSNIKVGGPGKIVEIDETLIIKRKNKEGQNLKETLWVVRGVCRQDNACFVCKVNDRCEQSLNWVISKYVNSGSTVCMDDSKGIDITHKSTKHAENVDPETDVHIQTIKHLWRCLKNRKSVPMHFTKDLSDSYLYFFMYKKMFRWERLKPGERFELFAKHLSWIYPGPGNTPIWKEPETVPTAPEMDTEKKDNHKNENLETSSKNTVKSSLKRKGEGCKSSEETCSMSKEKKKGN
ncbi:uncharacterized protein LOC111637587 isoform X1 [Centruroides sculpturatus]|uniref:uncharacterized protein LOC111637587 isoform X1 n=1 Tax=Centruroides sculpturatus TaxID=218467 RepID=UPI000C6EF426|nr:uncharacterized protein LOC111637587 isoform X1 [Centruroides sculpturatus]XP_023238873.1 uncharacterized protein LOC111637587 isoform X1 [Centruroides sculpturatus]XP_023238874.1 uncharacterized protein LOC111637587 isoform X1 [Centruroides sculpturatus]XP_023238875.1 uncharacterized protein LOC111637587 isoform X1 [Centruroides sculpturatus]XP_023238876.1 uncharacterized protein LOC111637587 isoform X1 [Centruroides sculpturatus]XP_023238877.1 uncharacterized protein LOC111637587 isoform 